MAMIKTINSTTPLTIIKSSIDIRMISVVAWRAVLCAPADLIVPRMP
ncbi:MAG: hypothetical protein ABI771_03570 [Betaproteobacteria bacterium]